MGNQSSPVGNRQYPTFTAKSQSTSTSTLTFLSVTSPPTHSDIYQPHTETAINIVTRKHDHTLSKWPYGVNIPFSGRMGRHLLSPKQHITPNHHFEIPFLQLGRSARQKGKCYTPCWYVRKGCTRSVPEGPRCGNYGGLGGIPSS